MGFEGYAFYLVLGYSCGIVIGWRKEKVDIIMELIYIQFIHTEVTHSNGRELFFTLTYASPREDGLKDFMRWLEEHCAEYRGGWIIGGGFNDIFSTSEKRRGAKVSSMRCNVFMGHINNCNLMEIQSTGHKFTLWGPTHHGGLRIYE